MSAGVARSASSPTPIPTRAKRPGARCVAPAPAIGQPSDREQPERDRRHLPVPVDAGVQRPPDPHREQHGVGMPLVAARPRRERRQQRQERREEQHEAHEPELGQRLEVERVRVLHLQVVRPVLLPALLEGPGALAGDRRAREALERHLPLVEPAVVAEVGQPAAPALLLDVADPVVGGEAVPALGDLGRQVRPPPRPRRARGRTRPRRPTRAAAASRARPGPARGGRPAAGAPPGARARLAHTRQL